MGKSTYTKPVKQAKKLGMTFMPLPGMTREQMTTQLPRPIDSMGNPVDPALMTSDQEKFQRECQRDAHLESLGYFDDIKKDLEKIDLPYKPNTSHS